MILTIPKRWIQSLESQANKGWKIQPSFLRKATNSIGTLKQIQNLNWLNTTIKKWWSRILMKATVKERLNLIWLCKDIKLIKQWSLWANMCLLSRSLQIKIGIIKKIHFQENLFPVWATKRNNIKKMRILWVLIN